MCTGVRFVDDKGNMYFGRNLDWSTNYGQHVVITPSGYKPNSPFNAIQTIAHPVIGMAIVVENTPLYFDAANDKGLAVAGLNFPGYACYEKEPQEGKTNIAAYEFPLWVTANFESVDEVEEALQNAAIVDKPINPQFASSQLHFIIGDKNRSIVVEYTKAGMQIFHDDFDVLTNQPGFDYHRENVRNYINVAPIMPEYVMWGKAKLVPFGSGSEMRGLPGDCYSPSRFVRVAYTNAMYPTQTDEASNVSRLFHTLSSVAMIDGGATMIDGNFERTLYTGGYSAATKTYYFNTYENFAISSVAMGDYDTASEELIEVK